MSEYSRTQYSFNSRLVLNDVTTDPDAYALVDPGSLMDTIANNTEEELPTDPGIVDYGVKFSKGEMTIPVTLYATSQAKMSQLIEDVKEAFNPDLLEADGTYGSATKFQGYHPLKWTELVGTTSRNFMVFLKSIETPIIEQDSLSGLIRECKIKLKARDPRKYLQAQSTLANAGTAVNAGNYNTPCEITITATGATSTSLSINDTTTSQSLYVGTALANADVLVIDTLLHSVKLNGTEKRSYLLPTSKYINLAPGNNAITVTNGTNLTFATKWYSAWSL